MIAFEVSVNGVRRTIAGINGDGCLTAMITWSRNMDKNKPGDEAHLQVGGVHLLDPVPTEALVWAIDSLSLGDVITVKIVETANVDPPQEVRPVRKLQS